MFSWRVLLVFASLLSLGAERAMATEEPKYTVRLTQGAFEVRDYAPQVRASVMVSGDRFVAANRGFGPLAEYIFGGNQPRQKIAMTTPVMQERRGGQKIAMTTPVMQEREGDAWTVSFVMPAAYDLEALPVPNNARVELNETPAKRMAVIRFSGFAPESTLDRKTAALRDFIRAQKLTPIGAPAYAFYNPPWTLPFMRRNEVMWEIKAE
jgi:hypothetical protein